MRLSAVVLMAVGLVLPACGGGDSETPPAAAARTNLASACPGEHAVITPAGEWSKTRDVYDDYEFSAPFTITNRASHPFPVDHSAVVVEITGGAAPRALASPLLNLNSTVVGPGQTVTFVSRLAVGVKVTAVRTVDVFAEASFVGVPPAVAPCEVSFDGAKPLRDAPRPQRGSPQPGSLVACGPAEGACR